MYRLQQFALMGLVYFSMFSALSAEKIICLQFPWIVDDTQDPIVILYYGDVYPGNTLADCDNWEGPGLKWFLETAVPQDCPAGCCNLFTARCSPGCKPPEKVNEDERPVEPVADPPEGKQEQEAAQQDLKTPTEALEERPKKLPKKFSSEHQFTTDSKEAVSDPTFKVWNPKSGIRVCSELSAKIETELGETIDVKLYIVEMDYKKAKLKAPTLNNMKKPIRVDNLGYETDGAPKGTISVGTFKWNDKKIKPVKAEEKNLFLLQLSENSAPYLVITNTNVFK